MQENQQNDGVAYADQPKRMEGQLPGKMAGDGGAEASERLPQIDTCGVDTNSDGASLALVVIGNQR